MESARERSRRPVRNKKFNRRIYGDEKKIPKRLFTPEIKRYLKDWLIRRRDNPYPNRDEKKELAKQTGLTYIQVCNWFANWRRKLKNAGKEPQRKTWGHLIKSYNSQVHGNVEHFSISSSDSIWEEDSRNNNDVSSDNPFSQNKYKSHIMEKYLRDCRHGDVGENHSMISKWLESAENFRPSESSYLSWSMKGQKKKRSKVVTDGSLQHGREELDAAEALTKLASTHRKN